MDKKVVFILPAYFGSNHSMFLGVGYLVSALKEHGIEAHIIDEDALNWIYSVKDAGLSLLLSEMRVLEELEKLDPFIICISINTANYKNGLRLLSLLRIRFSEKYIVVGGPHISVCYDSFHKWHSDLYDAAVIGEGENSIVELCESIFEGKKDYVKGIRFSKKPDFFEATKMSDVDALAEPARDEFFYAYKNKNEIDLARKNYERVFYSSLPGFENGHARIVVSRGCYNSCSFCSPGTYWKNPLNNKPCRRIRNPKLIADEIERLLREGINAFYFDDPTFPIKSNLRFFESFEGEIIERNLKFAWGAPICSSEIDSKILDRLQRLGFSYTYFGLENYNEQVLHDFHKMQNVENCLDLIYECRKRGIHCDASYQIGIPGETKENMKKSLDWIFQKNIERNVFYSITAIWPGTELALNYGMNADFYEPDFNKLELEKNKKLYFYEQGNTIVEQFYSNCSGTYHFIPMELAIEMKYYLFDKGLRNRFKGGEKK